MSADKTLLYDHGLGIDIPVNLLMRYLWEMKSSDGFNLGAVFIELHSCFTAVHLPTIAQAAHLLAHVSMGAFILQFFLTEYYCRFQNRTNFCLFSNLFIVPQGEPIYPTRAYFS